MMINFCGNDRMKGKIIVCVLTVVAVVLIWLIARHRDIGHGEITVYGVSGAEIEHFRDAGYERINSNTVIVYCGDREIKYINCTMKVEESEP